MDEQLEGCDVVPIRLRKYFSLFSYLSNQQIKDAWDNQEIEIVRYGRRKSSLHQDKCNSCEIESIKGLSGLTSIVFPFEDKILLRGEEVIPQKLKRTYISFYKPSKMLFLLTYYFERTKLFFHFLYFRSFVSSFSLCLFSTKN